VSVTRGRGIAWMAAGLILVLSLAFPIGAEPAGTPLLALAALRVVIGGFAFAVGATRRLDGGRLVLMLALVLAGALALLYTVHVPGIAGQAGPGFWTAVAGLWLAAWMANDALARARFDDARLGRLAGFAVPAIFGAFVFFLWEVGIVGFGVSPVLMPPPSAIVSRFLGSLPILGADFVQTFVRGVLSGYVIGCCAGFLVAILADRVAFLRRGLLPLGNFVSALPIVGIAPIMVMWFGFDWHSKAAVVVVMTFFPMLVNTVAGLSAAGALERDLMRSYAAGWLQTLVKLRLPAALPFVFNALKINATLALIGAIVAEFFGTPIVGMGFRISIEAARMALDMVWAEIVVAAIAGTAFYGLVAAIERATTFWHPSYRS
jgi:NitT/TauT family transport system permease protein